jgi:GntR family transcriptional regulator/MocR family aminotransferase
MLGLSPTLDKHSEIPVYKQLYSFMKQEIEAGRLQENDRLPSIRQLSAHLLLSKNTVETAYQQLQAEGYVHGKPRSGLHVLPLERLAPMKAPSSENGKNVGQRSRHAGQGMFDYQYGDIELEKFPMKAWRKCMLDALEAPPYEVLGYGERQGNAELRAEIVRYLYPSRGVECSPDQIFVCSGTQQAVSLLCQVLPLPSRVAMEDPGYNGVRAVLANHGRDVVPIPLEGDGLHVDELRRQAVNAVYVTPSHQFPLGSVLPVQKRGKLLQWAYEHEGLIIEDDYDSEFRYQGQPIPALKAMDAGDRVIYLGTFSKSFLPAIRMSFIVLPEKLAVDFRAGIAPYSQSTSPLLQEAMLRFMREGHYERHIRRMRKLYQTKHKILLKAIQLHLGDRVAVIGQRAGLHLLIDVRGRDSAELIESAAKVGVNVYSPREHWMDSAQCPSSYLMLGFGGVSDDKIEEGIMRLRDAWYWV